jgi:hypothetical protein
LQRAAAAARLQSCPGALQRPQAVLEPLQCKLRVVDGMTPLA